MHDSRDAAATPAVSPFPVLPRPRRAPCARAVVVAAGALALAVPAAGQGLPPRVHVSTTSVVQPVGSPTIDDASIVTAPGPGVPRPCFFEGHWQATIGFVPGDVDGFARRPGATPGSAASIAFSLLSNEGGFLDGDVLGLAPGGGVEVIVPESRIVAALGVPGANIDLDAIDFDSTDGLLFSLQSDLVGTTVGTVLDGDVLLLHQDDRVTVELTEADVQACFTVATGSNAAIGDVQAIECYSGEIWVAVQAPSSYDGAVLSCGGVPRILLDEAAMGLGGAELDALSEVRPGDDVPVLTFSPQAASAGSVLRVEGYGRPSSILVGVMGGASGYQRSARPGFGAWYIDPNDPWLAAVLASPPVYAVLDAQGRFGASWALPPVAVSGLGFGGELGWTFQALDLPNRELTAPVRVTEL